MSKVMLFDYDDDSSAVGRGRLRIYEHGNSGTGFYSMGDVMLPDGLVSVYRDATMTRLDICHDGRLHMRTWRKPFGNRSLPQMARDFMREVSA